MTEAAASSRLARLAGQLRALILTTLAVIIIAAAVLVGIGRTLLPHADALRPWLERQLSAQMGERVVIERVEAQWPRLTPSLTLIGLQVGKARAQGLEIDAARLEFHLPRLLDPGANLMRLVILEPEVWLAQDEHKRWGVELAAGALIRGSGAESRLPGVDVVVRNARLGLRPLVGPSLSLLLPEGGIRRDGDHTLLYGSVQSGPGRAEHNGLRLRLFHPDGQWQAAEGWLAMEDFALSDWLTDVTPGSVLDSTRANLESWLTWSADDDRIRLDLDFELFHGADSAPLAGRAMVVAEDQMVQVQADRVTRADQTIAEGLALARADRHWALAVDALDLGALHAALAPWLDARQRWPEAVDGRVHDLVLGLDQDWSVHAAEGRIEQLAFVLADPWPSVQGLDLRLDVLGDRLVVAPSGQPAMRWPRVLRGEVELDAMGGRVVLARDSVELQGLSLASAVVDASADGWIYLEQPRPFLDLFIRAERIGPVDPRPYLPHRIIPPPAMRWLDQALVRVGDARGHVNLHLRAGTRTRDLNPGSLQAHIDFAGVDLDYWPGWPRARALAGQVEFVGRRLSGQVERGRLGEIDVSAREVRIADLAAPELSLSLAASQIDAGDLATTLSAIPVAGWQAALAPMRWSGPLDASAALTLPFRRMADWDIAGSATLDGAAVELPLIDTRLARLAATVDFDRTGIEPVEVEAALVGKPLALNLAAGFESPAWLELAARLNPADLIPQAGVLGLLGRRTSGRSDWRYRLEQDRADEGIRMSLSGDLQGLALDWPAPFAKPAAAKWPFAAELLIAEGGLDLGFRLDDRLSGRLALDEERWASSLLFGDAPPKLPAPAGLTVSGEVEALALDDWLALLEPSANGAQPAWPQPLEVDLAAGRIELAGIGTGAGRLTVKRTSSALDVGLDSPELAGTLSVPIQTDAGRAIVADLARMHLPAGAEQALAPAPGDQRRRGRTSAFDPAGLPPFSIVVEDLRRGELELGRLRLEAHPVAAGLELELLDVSGPDLRLQGSGRWIGTEAGPRSQFAGRISTPSLSALLNSAGYDPGIEADRAQLDLDVQWPGAPADFSLSRLLGRLQLWIGDGQIPEARPGAGRLLGLVSFNAIPRRLMLDFRDVFSPGMRFDEIEGTFDLTGGVARTDGLVLRSTSAVMTIAGQTDMIAREYDQTLRVEPGLGASLPVIGGLAGGPVGAAAGLVLRQLLDGPLSEVAEARYRITGPWDAPQIELIDARVVEPDPNDPPAGQD
ncbi:MAG: YhdP family protein [Wenzhouxiangella sp.]